MSQLDQLYRLKSQLLTSGLQQKDNNLYQVINQLIGILSTPVSTVEEIINVDQPFLKYGVANLILSDLQIRTLNSNPQSFSINVDNPAANVIIPVAWFNYYRGNGTPFSSDQPFRLQWSGFNFDLFTAISFAIDTAPLGNYFQDSPRVTVNTSVFNPRGKSLQLSTPSDITGGDGNVLYSTLHYFVTAWDIQ